MRKILTSIVLATTLIFSSAVLSKSYAKDLKFYVMKYKGVEYWPDRSKTTKKQQDSFLKEIKKGKQLDNSFAKKYKENSNLMPFTDLYHEYGQVFENNHKFALAIYQDKNYNIEVLDAYFDYRKNMVMNFKNNLNLAKQRGESEDRIKKIQSLLESLEFQNKREINFLEQYYWYEKNLKY